MEVREVMTKGPVCCTPETPLPEVARMMVEFDCGEIPVVEGSARRPVGVVTDRDITCRTVAMSRNPLEMVARDVMSMPVVTVHPDATVEEVCDTMAQHQLRRVPVIDEGGSCCGIVSQADLAQRIPDRQSARVVKEVSRQAGHHA